MYSGRELRYQYFIRLQDYLYIFIIGYIIKLYNKFKYRTFEIIFYAIFFSF